MQKSSENNEKPLDYNLDYKLLGLKIGLEIHQQLDTGKLFCRCPSKLSDREPDQIIERRLRAVASELGEYDPAALQQYEKGLAYKYKVYKDLNCLIDLDEEPPKPPEPSALNTALQLAILSKAEIVDEAFVMRKIVVDGSNTTGFQRTMLIAKGGSIKTRQGIIGMQSLLLEEDSARTIEETPTHIIYNLDRLGIPLIEWSTNPEIFSPEQAREVALAMGSMLRSTGKAKRGLGTIRQDLNISIREGARIELKGVQDLDLIEEAVKREIKRQLGLLEIRRELNARKASPPKEEFKEISRLLEKSESKIISSALKRKDKIYSLKLPLLKGLLGRELQPGRRFGSELSDYVKAKSGLKGLLHSDELPGYGITEKELRLVEAELKAGEKDAYIMVIGSEEKCLKALKAVIARIIQAFKGVPEETRDCLSDGNSSYSRPLPGSARMYPETDLAPVEITTELLKEAKSNLPLSPEERVKLYASKGLNSQLAEKMKLNNYAPLYEKLLNKKLDPTSTAVFLLEDLVELRRQGTCLESLSDEELEELLVEASKKSIPRKALPEIIKKKARTGDSIQLLLEEFSQSIAGEDEIEKQVKAIVSENKKLVKEKGLSSINALMGDVMRRLAGKADGKIIAEKLKQEISRHQK